MKKRKEAFDKVMRVIKSCKTTDHIKVARRMSLIYSKRYKTFTDKLLFYDALEQRTSEINLEMKRR